MNLPLLDQKIKTLSSYHEFTPQLIDLLAEIIKQADGWQLRRINPVRLAESHGLDPQDATNLLILAARVGLFDLSWNLICPSCGGVMNDDDTVNGIGSGEEIRHCVICDIDVPVVMDDYVEVSFTISPDVSAHKIDPFLNHESYVRFFFSPNLIRSSQLIDYVQSTWRAYHVLAAGETKEIILNNWQDDYLRMVSISHHASFAIGVADSQAASPQLLIVDITERGFETNAASLQKGDIRLLLRNLTNSDAGMTIHTTDMLHLHSIIRNYPNAFHPFLTGKDLLNNQMFRDLFKIQNLVSGLKLNLRSLTILFTDLRGSTELYDRIGDVVAYNLIQDHFQVLGRSVKNHAGAIIKTMGDAIMATFSRPDDGLRAAMEMMSEIRSVKGAEGHGLGLKIGVHEGPALAINNNGMLDYFGQTVNVAARVQNLAKAGEIWVTETIFNAPDIMPLLASQQYRTDRHSVSLKGIGLPTTVYKCTREDHLTLI